MTKMTLLHFASPFAFSMPVPVPRPDRVHGTASKAATAVESSSLEAAPLLGSRSATAEDARFAASESAGFEASLYDTVLRRYREQIWTGSGAAPRAETEGSPA